MLSSARDMFSKFDLIWAWTYRIIRARYQQSILGGFWAILQPTATVAIFSVIFTVFIPVDTKGVPYVIFSYVAMVPWTLFSSSISDMVDSLVGNMNLVTKIYFPREILPISTLLARLFDFLISFSIVGILILYYRIPVFITGWLFIPLVLLIQIILAFGIGLIGAALNIFYRDMRPIFALGLQIWFYASPVIYPVSSVPERFRFVYYLNPMVGVIEAYRAIILNQRMPESTLLLSFCVAVIILAIGYWYFKRVEPQFADVV
ncbi:MAG: ABC transporter permease [Anaerolineales bacterium]